MGKLNKSLTEINQILKESNKAAWRSNELEYLLQDNYGLWKTGNSDIDKNIISNLVQENILRLVNISLNKSSTSRYVLPEVLPLEIVLSLRTDSYLSHYTAMYILGITNTIPKTIYSNLEQFVDKKDDKQDLVQLNVDKAFSKPMRRSKRTAKFELNNEKYLGILLSSNKMGKPGVKEVKVRDRYIHVTDIERTLIDATVRPGYCGGIEEVLNAFTLSKKECSVKNIINYLDKMNFIYPYQQALGFYLERAGYSNKDLKPFEKRISNIDFYLTYEMRKKSYSERWKLYFPAEFS